jgi:DNA-binding transcriptional ArsR family regulator
MDAAQMQDSAHRAADLMRSLANETRLMILCQLAEGEKSVGEIAALLNLRQAAVSQQLALLRKDGLVSRRRHGRSIRYALADRRAGQMIALLYELYCGAPGETPAAASGKLEKV